MQREMDKDNESPMHAFVICVSTFIRQSQSSSSYLCFVLKHTHCADSPLQCRFSPAGTLPNWIKSTYVSSKASLCFAASSLQLCVLLYRCPSCQHKAIPSNREEEEDQRTKRGAARCRERVSEDGQSDRWTQARAIL